MWAAAGRNCPIFLAAAGVAAMVWYASGAEAAVRHCAPRIEAAADDATSEQAARRQAMANWTELARRIGQGYTRWQLAENRTVQCARIPGGFRCRAGAAPCTVSQDPGRIPQELLPKAPAPAPAVPFPPRRKGIDA